MQRARRTPQPDELEPRSESLVEGDDPAYELSDFADVPAAVVCAVCGKPECGGCDLLEERTHSSGVVAIIPWERSGLGWLTRLWATARLATLSHRELFSSLPEGGVRAPLAFALLAELLAAAGLTLVCGGLFALAPDIASLVLSDATLRSALLRTLAVGVPGLAVFMVLLHVLHGVFIDRAARRAGSAKRGRGLRFGLYACGWDLVTLPIGLLALLVSEGPAAAGRAAALALSAPEQATRAYLTGVHALPPSSARAVARRATLATVAAAAGVLALIGVLAFASL